MSKTLQYTTWVLPVNGELWNQMRIILAGYLVPRDAVKELSSNLIDKEILSIVKYTLKWNIRHEYNGVGQSTFSPSKKKNKKQCNSQLLIYIASLPNNSTQRVIMLKSPNTRDCELRANLKNMLCFPWTLCEGAIGWSRTHGLGHSGPTWSSAKWDTSTILPTVDGATTFTFIVEHRSYY